MTSTHQSKYISILYFLISIVCITNQLMASNITDDEKEMKELSTQSKFYVMPLDQAFEELKNAFNIHDIEELREKVGSILVQEDYEKAQAANDLKAKKQDEIKDIVRKSLIARRENINKVHPILSEKENIVRKKDNLKEKTAIESTSKLLDKISTKFSEKNEERTEITMFNNNILTKGEAENTFQ